MSATIFKGTKAKALRNTLTFKNEYNDVVSLDSNPTGVVDAGIGSLAMGVDGTTGTLFVKTGPTSADWAAVPTTGGIGGSGTANQVAVFSAAGSVTGFTGLTFVPASGLTSAVPVYGPSGSVSAPSFAPSNDTDTGLYFQSGVTRIASNGVSAVSLNQHGLGIGADATASAQDINLQKSVNAEIGSFFLNTSTGTAARAQSFFQNSAGASLRLALNGGNFTGAGSEAVLEGGALTSSIRISNRTIAGGTLYLDSVNSNNSQVIGRTGTGTGTERIRWDNTGVSIANQLFNWVGSASQPSITFTADPDTGMFTPDTDSIGWSTNAVEKMRLTSSGNLAIGTTTAGSTYTGLSANMRSLTITGNGSAATTSRGVLALTNNRPTASLVDDIAGEILFISDNNGTSPSNGSRLVGDISTRLTGSGGTNGFGGQLEFYVKGDNAASLTRAMNITSAGRVLLNTATEDTAIRLFVNGRVGANAAGSNDGFTGKTAPNGTYIYGLARQTNGLALKSLDSIFFYPAATDETTPGTLMGSVNNVGAWTIGSATSVETHRINGITRLGFSGGLGESRFTSRTLSIANQGVGVSTTITAGANGGLGGLYLIQETNSGRSVLVLTGDTVSIVFQTGTNFTNVADNPSTQNVFFSGGQIKIQNRTGATNFYRVTLMSAADSYLV